MPHVPAAIEDPIPDFFESKLREQSTTTDETIRSALASHNAGLWRCLIPA
jgi:hypothetical protein